MLDDKKAIEQVAYPSYKDLETFDFQLLLDKNLDANLNSVDFVFPIKFLKKSDVNADIATDLITVNNFFAHWIKEISITKFGINKELSPTTTPQEIYQYYDVMLKNLPEKSLKVIEDDFLYSQKPVLLQYGFDRRVHRSLLNANKRKVSNKIRTDANFRDRETKFRYLLKNKYVYRIPLKYICDIGKINFPTKIDMKIRLTFETDMKKLFESDKDLSGALKTGKLATSTDPDDINADGPPTTTPDAQIVLLKAPML